MALEGEFGRQGDEMSYKMKIEALIYEKERGEGGMSLLLDLRETEREIGTLLYCGTSYKAS